MAVEQDASARPLAGTAYGRFVRERGTLKLVVAAAVIAALWYGYDSYRVMRMKQVKWPALSPMANGLTVLGLRDKDRPGWRHKYEAWEMSHAWQIRYRDDTEGGSDDNPDEAAEMQDRGPAPPGGSHAVNRGAVVPMAELMRECPVVLTGAQFTGAWVEERYEPLPLDRHYWIVHVDLSDEGRSRYWQFSRDHDKERLLFVLNGQVLTCPRMDSMDASSLEIQPIWVKADADVLADTINRKGR